MSECAFCSDADIRAREIYRDAHVFAFPTNIPIVPGHVLLTPVRHVVLFSELAAEERDALFSLIERLKIALRRVCGAEGFHFAWNEGEVAGQSVPHFHIHLVPRKAGDAGITEYEPRKFLYRPGSRQQSPAAELSEVAHKIKTELRV